MKKKLLCLVMALSLVTAGLCGCQNASKAADKEAAEGTESTKETAEAVEEDTASAETAETATAEAAEATKVFDSTEIQVFIAASLNNAVTDIVAAYNQTQPNVKITLNADSSGTLLQQIENGYACDIFFSAAQKQMDTLQNTDGLVVDGTRANVVNNQVCVVSLKESGTKVTGLENLKDASSIALADGSVPVGKYTRQALVNLGILAAADDVSTITTQQVSDALGGVEISEQGNVSKVLTAVTEGSSEVGTVYKSDTFGFEDKLSILQVVPYDLTGNVIYPVALVKNEEATALETEAATDFYHFLLSDTAKTIYEKYYFDTNVEK